MREVDIFGESSILALLRFLRPLKLMRTSPLPWSMPLEAISLGSFRKTMSLATWSSTQGWLKVHYNMRILIFTYEKNWAPGMHLWDFRRAGIHIWDFWMKQIAHAVAFLHSKNVCHRDLKLEKRKLEWDLWKYFNPFMFGPSFHVSFTPSYVQKSFLVGRHDIENMHIRLGTYGTKDTCDTLSTSDTKSTQITLSTYGI